MQSDLTNATPFILIRNPYNYDRDLASRNSGLECKDPSLTSQEFKEESDINYQLEQFGITGEINITASKPLQGDFSDVGDYRSMLDQIKAADEAFKALPAPIRRQFNDDPAQFTDFVTNPENKEKLREWGFLNPDTPPADPHIRVSDLKAALEEMRAATSSGNAA